MQCNLKTPAQVDKVGNNIMARYTITYSCGHTADKQLFGKIDDRDNYINWCKEHKLCPECQRKLAAEKREEEYNNALKNIDALPALTGSEKQIKWAISIRQRWIDIAREYFESKGKTLDEVKDILLKKYSAEKDAIESSDCYKYVENYFMLLLHALTTQSAAFFIDHRRAFA